MSLGALPAIDRVTLASVGAVPEWHPEHATFRPFPVHGWVVRHPDGIVLVDTGIGGGHPLIDEWYQPRITLLDDALAAIEVDVRDVVAIVLSHLHFDHCGQHGVVDAPVYVQKAEHDVAREIPAYSVPEWSTIPEHRLRLIDGDVEIADGLHVIATPGHTPGHQSVVVEGGSTRVALAAQCAFGADEIRSGEPRATNLHDDDARDTARDSLRRIRSLAPITAQLSHDPEIVNL